MTILKLKPENMTFEALIKEQAELDFNLCHNDYNDLTQKNLDMKRLEEIDAAIKMFLNKRI